MALLNDYLEKDLHLFDLKTLLEDVDRFSELTSPELHYFCLVDNKVLTILRSHTRYRLWTCSSGWSPYRATRSRWTCTATYRTESTRPLVRAWYKP